MTTASSPIPTTPTLNPATIEAAIIELLASALEMTPIDVRRELAAAGTELPVDSLLVIEIICELEAQFGVTLPEDQLTADSLRSVRLLAQRVSEIAAVAHARGA
ncbi:MAG: acyl carrier protein [Acidimicrobiia bacterium]